MLRSDAEYIKSLRSRALELRASDEKKAERIEKLAMFVDATLAARHWYEGHPEGALEEIEKRANDLLIEQPALEEIATRVQQCAGPPGDYASIYNAMLRWKRLEDERALKIRGCLLAGPGRGDCKNFVNLPKVENRETTDEYGRPHGWCQVCWLAERELRLCKKVRELSLAALQFISLTKQGETDGVDGDLHDIASNRLFELAGGEVAP